MAQPTREDFMRYLQEYLNSQLRAETWYPVTTTADLEKMRETDIKAETAADPYSVAERWMNMPEYVEIGGRPVKNVQREMMKNYFSQMSEGKRGPDSIIQELKSNVERVNNQRLLALNDAIVKGKIEGQLVPLEKQDAIDLGLLELVPEPVDEIADIRAFGDLVPQSIKTEREVLADKVRMAQTLGMPDPSAQWDIPRELVEQMQPADLANAKSKLVQRQLEAEAAPKRLAEARSRLYAPDMMPGRPGGGTVAGMPAPMTSGTRTPAPAFDQKALAEYRAAGWKEKFAPKLVEESKTKVKESEKYVQNLTEEITKQMVEKFGTPYDAAKTLAFELANTAVLEKEEEKRAKEAEAARKKAEKAAKSGGQQVVYGTTRKADLPTGRANIYGQYAQPEWLK